MNDSKWNRKLCAERVWNDLCLKLYRISYQIKNIIFMFGNSSETRRWLADTASETWKSGKNWKGKYIYIYCLEYRKRRPRRQRRKQTTKQFVAKNSSRVEHSVCGIQVKSFGIRWKCACIVKRRLHSAQWICRECWMNETQREKETKKKKQKVREENWTRVWLIVLYKWVDTESLHEGVPRKWRKYVNLNAHDFSLLLLLPSLPTVRVCTLLSSSSSTFASNRIVVPTFRPHISTIRTRDSSMRLDKV